MAGNGSSPHQPMQRIGNLNFNCRKRYLLPLFGIPLSYLDANHG